MMEGSGVERATSGSLVRRPTITPLRHATVQLQEYNVQRWNAFSMTWQNAEECFKFIAAIFLLQKKFTEMFPVSWPSMELGIIFD